MARTRVDLNDAGMEALLHDPGVTADLEARMARALQQAQATAPVATGAYRDSLHVEVVQHPSRSVVRVVSDVDYAMTVEAAHGVLARALDAAGGE